MEHRHMINTFQNFETEYDQRWIQAEQTLMPIARTGAPECSSHIHPLANTAIQGGHYPSHWNNAPSSSGYSSSIHNVELPVYQQQAPGPSHDPFLCQPAAVNFHMFPDNYSYYPSSSDLGGLPTPVPDGGFYDHSTGSFRGPYKRKTPDIPPCDRGSTSRCFDVGSSSNLHLPSDPWQEKHTTESHHAPHEYLPNYRAHNLPNGNEGMLRNVRSRAAVDLETNMTRTHLSSNPLHYPFPSRPSDQSNSADFWGQSLNAPTRELNHSLISPNDHGLTYGPDSSFFGHGPNSVCAQSTHQSGSVENSVYRNDLMSNRNPAPQNVHVNSDQPGRDVRSGYGPRTIPTFRTSSSNLRHGHMAASDEGLHMVSERYPSRDPRPFSTIRWRNNDRNGRNLTSSDRYRSFTEDANFRNRLTPEGVILDYSSFYGSRTLFDQHRDMRLDVDNMSYEELLALGERIGNVNTGLSDDLISESVTEFIYGSSDLSQDEGTCVICLEEYKNMDDVGTLKVCRHDFHVVCIKKWLSMKNSCPICKSSAFDDSKEN